MLKQARNRERQRPQALAVPAIRELRAQPTRLRVPTFRHELGRSRQPARIVVSAAVHIVVLGLALAIMARMPVVELQTETPRQSITLVAPVVQAPPPRQTVVPPPELVAQAEPVQVQPPRIPRPPVQLPKVVEKKSVEVARLRPPVVSPKTFPAIPVLKQPVQPKKVVTNTFASTNPAPLTNTKPTREVQTGAFGDPNGVPSKSQETNHLQMARLGSFDGGMSGRETSRSRGGGTVASSGFGDGLAVAGGGGSRGKVAVAGFGEVTAVSPASRPLREAQPAMTPVQIEYKPRPVYTEEARRLGVQGEVILEILFQASGKLQTQRVVSGLGHGLDEAAKRAAGQIRFLPAKRDGHPYDSVALVHIVFELAQ